MNTYPIIVAAGAALVLAGLLGAIYAWRYEPQRRFRTRATRVQRAGRIEEVRQRTIRLTIAGVGGALAWLLTGWPVAGLTVAAIATVMPFLLAGPRINKRRIERLEALEEWVRRLSASIAAGSAPVQTLVKSADHAPAPLRLELARLATRLRTPRLDRSISLRQFADDIDDPLGDVVAKALTRAVSTRATERAPLVLEGLAMAVASEVRARRALERDRTGPRRETLLVTTIVGIFVVGVIAFTDWTRPYDNADGQIVLAILGSGTLLALWMMRRLNGGRTPPRLLSSTASDAGEPR